MFDSYTLHQVLVEKEFKQNSRIFCKGIVDLSLNAKSETQLLPLSECLMEIQKLHRGKQIDVVIDELDSEELNEEQVGKVNSILKTKEFKSSKIVIAFQACKKKRQYEQGGQRKETSSFYEKLEGFKYFKLKKSMRCTSEICKTIKGCQKEVEAKPNTYFVDFPRQKAIKESPQREEHERPEEKVEQQMENQIKITTAQQQPIRIAEEPDCMKEPDLKLEDFLKKSAVKEGDKKITSRYNYFEVEESFNQIDGCTPNLLQLKSNTNVRPLAHFIRKLIDPKRMMMVIANTKEMVELAKAALNTFKLPFVQYTDAIDEVSPKSTSQKWKILKEWKEKKVLLVDCRGCRGMECEKVIIFVKGIILLSSIKSCELFSFF